MLAKIILNYEITSLQPREEIKFTNELILRPVNGIKLFFKKRSEFKVSNEFLNLPQLNTLNN